MPLLSKGIGESSVTPRSFTPNSITLGYTQQNEQGLVREALLGLAYLSLGQRGVNNHVVRLLLLIGSCEQVPEQLSGPGHSLMNRYLPDQFITGDDVKRRRCRSTSLATVDLPALCTPLMKIT